MVTGFPHYELPKSGYGSLVRKFTNLVAPLTDSGRKDLSKVRVKN